MKKEFLNFLNFLLEIYIVIMKILTFICNVLNYLVRGLTKCFAILKIFLK